MRCSPKAIHEESQLETLHTYRPGDEGDLSMLKRCREAMRTIAPDVEVILFGSRARGDSLQGSDWDLLVLCDNVTPTVRHRIARALYDVELATDEVINPLVLPRGEWRKGKYREHPLHRAVDREGVLL